MDATKSLPSQLIDGQLAFWNSVDVRRALGSEGRPLPASTLYFRVKEGTLTPPVKFGTRSALWPRAEVEACIRARIAGADNCAVRQLVTELIAARKAGV